MANKIEFLPAIPLPSVFDVQERINQLRSYLGPKDPRYEREEQHDNIKAVIKLYEDGKIDGSQHVYIIEGKIVTREEVSKKGMA
jgi:O-phosphoseryl-tRNA(Cys) synthetase